MKATHPSCSSQPSRLTLLIRSAEARRRWTTEASRLLISIDRARAALVATASVVLASSLLAPATEARPYSPADLLLYERLSEPDLSPNEDWAAYVVSKKLEEKDAYESQVWLVDIQSRGATAVTAVPGGASSPQFSPSGEWLAVLADQEKEGEEPTTQVCLLPLKRPGALACVSDAEDGVLDFAWAPDSQSLALVIEPDIDPLLDHIPEDTEAPIVLDRLLFKHDNAGYLKNTKQQIVLLSLDTKITTPLTSPHFDSVLPTFSPDGSRIAFVSKRGADPDRHENWDIYELDIETPSNVRKLTQSTGPDGDPSWWNRPIYSPSGERLLYLDGGDAKDIWYALQTVGEVDLQTGRISNLSKPLDRNCTSPRFDVKGKAVFCLLEDDRSVQLAKLSADQGQPERLTPSGKVIHDYRVGNAGILTLQSTINEPAQLFWQPKGQSSQQLTQHNAWVDERQPLVAGELIAKAKSGLRPSVHAVMLTPADSESPVSEGPMPTLLHLHGGPVAQHQYDFDIEQHIMASAGYRIVAPNPRGSSGRGFDYQYAIWAKWGGPDGEDIRLITDTLLREGLADPTHLGVYGWSYGGMLTNYAITRDQRYRAAVSGAGISNMLGGFGVDHYIVAWEQEVGMPWDNLEGWLKLSYPFLEAPAIKTPTLFMVGEADFNVPAVGSEQMYQALRYLEIPTQLVIYPGQHHSFTVPSYEVDALVRHLDWFETYLGRNASQSLGQ